MANATRDSLTKSYTTPGFAGENLDSGPWGKSVFVPYHPGQAGDAQTKTNIMQGERAIDDNRGEPLLRTFQVSIDRRCQQPLDATSRDPELSDVNAVVIISYGVGGAGQEAEISVRRGTTFSVAATWWRLSAYVEPVLTFDGEGGLINYPDPSNGAKTVKLNANCVLGGRQGGALLPSRDKYYVIAGEAPNNIIIPIPDQAVNVAVRLTDAAGDAPAGGSVKAWARGADNKRISRLTSGGGGNFEMGSVYEIPGASVTLELDYTGVGGPYIACVSWGLFL